MYAVIRVRGRTGIRPEIKYTMNLLNLTRVNHCVLVLETPHIKGMLQKCKDYVTWGEVSEEVLVKLLKKRGRKSGNVRLTEDDVKAHGGFEGLAKSLMEGKAKVEDVGLKKVFRLHPPRGGYKSIKRPYPRGDLGYRGEAVNDLLARMI